MLRRLTVPLQTFFLIVLSSTNVAPSLSSSAFTLCGFGADFATRSPSRTSNDATPRSFGPPTERRRVVAVGATTGRNDPDSFTVVVEADVSIEYCTGCKWMLRAAWLSQELLTTFQDDLRSVKLVPSRPPAPGGTFIVTLNDEVELWNRKSEGRFPEAKELKQRLRDAMCPDRDLGHSDVGGKQETTTMTTTTTLTACEDCDDKDKKDDDENQGETPLIETMDDDDAEEMRNLFGVA